MVYDVVAADAPLRQGDILYPIPMIAPPALDSIELLTKDGEKLVDWSATFAGQDDHIITAKITPVCGIVATQDCDACRSPEISCFYVGDFYNVSRLTPATSIDKQTSLIMSQTQIANKWFYLPPDEEFGFAGPMAANFLRIFQLDMESLIPKLPELRRGRLNDIAYEHYRECIAQHFRRYPFNPWYPLTKEQFAVCKDENKFPYEWQK